jgi:hypothetical protein
MRRGFSLLEAVIALFIIATSYVSIAQLFQITRAETIASRNRVLAQHLATNLFEAYRVKLSTVLRALKGRPVKSSEDVLADGAMRTLLTRDVTELTELVKAARFRMKVEVERGYAGQPRLDRVQVEVTWEEGGRSRSARHVRLILS